MVFKATSKLHIPHIGRASIRDVVRTVNTLQKETGIPFIRMEMGVPSLPLSEIGKKAEIEAIKNNLGQSYPMLDGIPELKEASADFIEAFIDVQIPKENIIPVTGSMQGSWLAFMSIIQSKPEKNKILFIDPGFPVQKLQLTTLGYDFVSFDVFHFRGSKLESKLESMLNEENIAAIVYSNPNNPTWACLRDEELEIIGNLSNKFDCPVIEDLAYFAMDFRSELGVPYHAPFQPSVAKYAKKYVLLISSSKIFSNAGNRIGVVAISENLYHSEYDSFWQRYGTDHFGEVFINKFMYAVTAGVNKTAQAGLAALFRSSCMGEINFTEPLKEYGERAKLMKELFLNAGFKLVYDKDFDEDIANGFYFTLGYKNMHGCDLSRALLSYGVSSISLANTGSDQNGIRACTSFVKIEQLSELEKRIKLFTLDY